MESLLDYGTSTTSSSGSDGDDIEEHAGSEADKAAEPPGKRPRVAPETQHTAATFSLDDWEPPSLTLLPPPGAGDGEVQKHQGRLRSFPHMEGNYPTHVYIAVCVPDREQQHLESLLQQVKAQLPGLEPVRHGPNGTQAALAAGSARPGGSGSNSSSNSCGEGGSCLAQGLYHISLSRTVAVRYHQIATLVDSLKQQLRKLEAFSVTIGWPEVLVNDERTRTFLCLSATAAPAPAGAATGRGTHPATTAAAATAVGTPAAASSSTLLRAIDATNRSFQMHCLPRFYAQPRPHISVAWLLGDCEAQLQGALASQAAQEAAAHLEQCNWRAQVDKVYCKTGQKPFIVWEAKTWRNGRQE